MATQAEFLAQVKVLAFTGISDADIELDDPDIDAIVKAALERYSHDKPEETTQDFTGDGGRYYDLTGASIKLSSFVDGFSSVIRVEYPAQAVSADEPPQYLDNEDFDDDYWAGGIRYLFFPNHAPASTETVRVRFTAPYTFTNGSVSTPAQDFYAISCLASAMACQTVSIRYSRSTDSTLTADSVDHLSKADQFSRRADELMRKYNEQMGFITRQGAGDTAGGAGTGVPAFGTFVDMDTKPAANRRWLMHGDR